MVTNLIIFIFGVLSISYIIAYFADKAEQREFRESLVPGMSVLINIDTGDKAVATVTKIFYDKDNPTCNLSLLIEEEYVELTDVPIDSVYKPNNYRI